jgi:hypothetical protein
MGGTLNQNMGRVGRLFQARLVFHTRRVAICMSLAGPLVAAALGPTQPFTPPTVAPRGTADLELNTADHTSTSSGLAGVRLGASPQALIDGRWVALGALVREGRLVRVQAHGVTLHMPGNRMEQLPLFPPATALHSNPVGEPTRADPVALKRVLP